MSDLTSEYKHEAKRLQDRLNHFGIQINFLRCLEAVAAVHNFPTWNALVAKLKDAELNKVESPEGSNLDQANRSDLPHACPRCGAIATTVEQAITIFGYRKTPDRMALQSWCRSCRGSHQILYGEHPNETS